MMLASLSASFRKYRDFFALLRVASRRNLSPSHYAIFQEQQAQLLVNYFIEQQIEIKGKRVLDLACGPGGYSIKLRKYGADVTALDLYNLPVDTSLRFVRGNALNQPFSSGQFDIILCASLIEHIEYPELLLSELERVVKPAGFVYLSFPPFYSLTGGHQYAPFHYLGEKTSSELAYFRDRLFQRKWFGEILNRSSKYTEAFGDWGLYKLTIHRANQLIKRSKFRIRNRSTRWLPLDFSGVPVLGEVLTWHVQYLLEYIGEAG